MSCHAPLAVPVLDTAVGIFIPPSTLVLTVNRMVTINRWRGVCTVLIAFITDRPLTTVNIFREVTPIIPWVKHCSFWIIIWLGAESVLWLGLLIETMPECSTVELIWKPSSPEVFALNMLTIRGAVCWSCWCVLTVQIALITHRPATTLGLLWKVAPHVRSVKHGGFWVITFLWAHDMVSMGLPLETVPELPTVVLIRIVSWTILVCAAVNDLVRGAAVRLLGGGGDGCWTVHRIITWSVTTFHIPRICTILIKYIILEILLTCPVPHTTSITLIKLPAGCRVWLGKEVFSSTGCSIRKGGLTITLTSSKGDTCG